jgi:xanthine/CO dehydrogenase XdhC/CoxF family maturation factor
MRITAVRTGVVWGPRRPAYGGASRTALGLAVVSEHAVVFVARRGEPFAVATVVRCERPTSAKPGAKALIRQDGTVSGWIGGSCAEPVAVKEALGALEDGEPRFLILVGKGQAPLGRADGVREYTMTCHSGGTLEIFVEPVLPKPALILVGSGPVVHTLAGLAAAARFAVTVVEPESPAPERLGGARVVDALASVAVTPRTAIVVATHGRFDEEALEQALRSEADYVSLVASPTRARAVLESLRAGDPRGPSVPSEGPGRARPRGRHAGGDRGQHPGRDHRAPPAPASRGGVGGGPARGRVRRSAGSGLRDDGSSRDGTSPLRERRGRRLFLLRGMPGAIRARAGSLRGCRTGLTSPSAPPCPEHAPYRCGRHVGDASGHRQARRCLSGRRGAPAGDSASFSQDARS